MDDIGNLENAPRLVFIDEECGNPIVLDDGKEITININHKRKPNVLQ